MLMYRNLETIFDVKILLAYSDPKIDAYNFYSAPPYLIDLYSQKRSSSQFWNPRCILLKAYKFLCINTCTGNPKAISYQESKGQIKNKLLTRTRDRI